MTCTSALTVERGNAPMDLYRAGNYEAAVAAGEAEGSGESLAVAARAVLADANLRDVPCMTCLQRAEALARRSIALDTQHPEPYVYLATALGYEARIVGSLRARFARYPDQAKEAIDRALAVAPNDSWSLAAAGTWHIEVVRHGGSLLARALFGARLETGEDYLRRAVAAEPQNLVIRFQRALLLSGDSDANTEAATSELAAATMTEPRTAYERAIKARAARLLDLIQANRRQEYMALVNRYQGYPS
jgi:tetratricopeptide (TPR) repeat protein